MSWCSHLLSPRRPPLAGHELDLDRRLPHASSQSLERARQSLLLVKLARDPPPVGAILAWVMHNCNPESQRWSSATKRDDGHQLTSTFREAGRLGVGS
jgi:hypothetical protein